MDEISAEFIERYQRMYERDPKSKVFAPLAEAYRKSGMIKEALEVAEKGIQFHPDFSGGHVALGKIYFDLSRFKDAEKSLARAVQLSPENILAHQLLADTLLRLKKSKEALKVYKMLLFLSPEHQRAQIAVRKLESLTADEFDEDVFAMKPLKETIKEWDDIQLDFMSSDTNKESNKNQKTAFIDRILSLADAYLVRNDTDRALEALNEAEKWVGSHPEVVKRLKLIHHRQLDTMAYPKTAEQVSAAPSRAKAILDNKIDFLQDLLQKFNNRKSSLT